MKLFNFSCHQTMAKKFHSSMWNFESERVSDTIWALYNAKKVVNESFHATEQRAKRGIAPCDVDLVLENGTVFEYKVDSKHRLQTLAIRIERAGSSEDDIYVLAPRENNGEIIVTVVTAYSNKRDDNHASLDTNKYAR